RRRPSLRLTFSEEDNLFRKQFRTWLEENMADFPLRGSQIPPYVTDYNVELQKRWQRMLYEGGWSGIHWPKEYGGRGATLTQQLIYCEELIRADAPDIIGIHFVGQQHAGPTIIVH